MDLDLMERLLALMQKGGLTELEWQDGEVKIRLTRQAEGESGSGKAASPALGAESAARPPLEEPPAGGEEEPGVVLFRSPMVGTFYRASGPEAEPFVQVGDRVDEESVLCILEAMKVMNEIIAECSGEVIEILAENGEPV
ncbi:MAG: acetyl-CoA carboxylase biotin carboxyl carrier protein, partial [Planctomycetota bacterium]